MIVLPELPLGSAIASMAKGSITQLVGSFAVSSGQLRERPGLTGTFFYWDCHRMRGACRSWSMRVAEIPSERPVSV